MYLVFTKDVPLADFMYTAFTCMPGESYHRRLRSLLLCLCGIFRALINSLVCWFCMRTLDLVPFQIAVIYQYRLWPCFGRWTFYRKRLAGDLRKLFTCIVCLHPEVSGQDWTRSRRHGKSLHTNVPVHSLWSFLQFPYHNMELDLAR